MTGRRAAIVLVAAALWTGRGHASFTDQFVGPAGRLGRAMSDTVARAIPVPAASPGLTFSYDPSSGAYERDTDLIGQLYLERAKPIGRGKWNVSVSYQRVQVDSIQGRDTSSFEDTQLPIIATGGQQTKGAPRGQILLKYDRYDVHLAVDEMILAATYGITDDLDVNLTLPMLASTLSIAASGRAFGRNTTTNALVPFPPSIASAQFVDSKEYASGVGDLFLRAKYRFLSHRWGELAAGLLLRAPTGNPDDFQGTGNWELSPLLYASTRRIPLGGSLALQGFVNGGVDLNLDDVDHSEGRFGVGIDLAFGRRATISLAFLGREPFFNFAPNGFFDVPRYNPRTGCPNACPNGAKPMAPLFGLETARPSYYSLSLGGRVNLWRDTVFGFANVLLPLNDEGIHTDPIPLIGFEATF